MRKLIILSLVFMIVGCVPAQASPTQMHPAPVATPNGGSANPNTTRNQKISFSVGPDKALSYPGNLYALPDEHSTFVPPAAGSDSYLVFTAATSGFGSPLVLNTKDLQSFTLAAGFPSPVMSPLLSFKTCKSAFDPEFDLNYAAPGSVLQDPTRAPGNLIMIYEAENHCPGGVWQQPFYVTVGFTRSPDSGKTWPPPVDSELGGPNRYPVLKGPVPEPITPEQPPVALGDALPSAFMDGTNLYVIYNFSNPGADGLLRIARAALGGPDPVHFLKWNQNAFNGAGIGGPDTGFLISRACGPGYEGTGSISRSDALGLYLLTFVCITYQKDSSGTFQPAQGAWYFSTATSLDLENWTAPQMIQNSQISASKPCSAGGSGTSFDGWYPSFMSPGFATGHLSATGLVFFLNGCDTGKRSFMSRTFGIQTSP